MALQVLIIGLGQFGMSLAKTLADKGAEIVGVDIDKEAVNVASAFLDDAICMDATEESALAKLTPQKRDIVVCAIGSKEPSILSTALLVEMGCENVVARATDKIHERILNIEHQGSGIRSECPARSARISVQDRRPRV